MLLAQELTNLLVHVTQEVHIRGPTIVALILHQEVLENQLQLVFLFHHHELKDNKFNSLILRLKKKCNASKLMEERTLIAVGKVAKLQNHKINK